MQSEQPKIKKKANDTPLREKLLLIKGAKKKMNVIINFYLIIK